MPLARIYYAVKANPAAPILERLVGLGSAFDAASLRGSRACASMRAPSRPRSRFGNTIKKVSAIQRAYAAGVTMFAFDSDEELEKLARHAPGSRVYCRLLVENKGADWPLSRKFGTTVDSARDLMIRAGKLGLDPYGLSFHVGSQQMDTAAYEVAIGQVGMLFTDLRDAGVNLRMVNLGGGFPVRYRDEVPTVDRFANAIMHAMTEHFGNDLPEILIEPGRSMVGDAGVVTPRWCWSAAASQATRLAGSTSTSAASAGWRRRKASRSSTGSTRRMTATRPARSASPARPATARTSCTSAATTACRWRWRCGETVNSCRPAPT